jgi:hypothetical protein
LYTNVTGVILTSSLINKIINVASGPINTISIDSFSGSGIVFHSVRNTINVTNPTIRVTPPKISKRQIDGMLCSSVKWIFDMALFVKINARNKDSFYRFDVQKQIRRLSSKFAEHNEIPRSGLNIEIIV